MINSGLTLKIKKNEVNTVRRLIRLLLDVLLEARQGTAAEPGTSEREGGRGGRLVEAQVRAGAQAEAKGKTENLEKEPTPD